MALFSLKPVFNKPRRTSLVLLFHHTPFCKVPSGPRAGPSLPPSSRLTHAHCGRRQAAQPVQDHSARRPWLVVRLVGVHPSTVTIHPSSSHLSNRYRHTCMQSMAPSRPPPSNLPPCIRRPPPPSASASAAASAASVCQAQPIHHLATILSEPHLISPQPRKESTHGQKTHEHTHSIKCHPPPPGLALPQPTRTSLASCLLAPPPASPVTMPVAVPTHVPESRTTYATPAMSRSRPATASRPCASRRRRRSCLLRPCRLACLLAWLAFAPTLAPAAPPHLALSAPPCCAPSAAQHRRLHSTSPICSSSALALALPCLRCLRRRRRRRRLPPKREPDVPNDLVVT